MTTSMGYLGKVLEQGRRLAVKPFSIGSREDLDTSISGLQKKCAAVLSSRGQASGARTAAQVLEIYEQYEDDDKEAFFDVLLADFSQDKDQLVDACRTYSADPTQEHLQALAGFMEPERQELFRRLNLVPGGTACLVQMRQDLLKILPRRPDLKPVDQDFLHLFRSWFNRGFLTLRPVSWSSPAIVLERLIKYEAVHEIDGWGDLKNRLDPEDRYCYAFFHPNLINDPLIFVEVALCREIPSSVQNILRDDREHLKAEDASVAAFYSISNCQKGLQGISFGNFLIKQVVENLRVQYPNIKRFVTLSPLPGFSAWLSKDNRAEAFGLSTDNLLALSGQDAGEDATLIDQLQDPMTRAALAYLTAKKPNSTQLVDSVARFHLGNGARIEKLQWRADVSDRGRRRAFGVMVNYLYELDQIEANHEAFVVQNEVKLSPALTALSKQASRHGAGAGS